MTQLRDIKGISKAEKPVWDGSKAGVREYMRGVVKLRRADLTPEVFGEIISMAMLEGLYSGNSAVQHLRSRLDDLDGAEGELQEGLKSVLFASPKVALQKSSEGVWTCLTADHVSDVPEETAKALNLTVLWRGYDFTLTVEDGVLQYAQRTELRFWMNCDLGLRRGKSHHMEINVGGSKKFGWSPLLRNEHLSRIAVRLSSQDVKSDLTELDTTTASYFCSLENGVVELEIGDGSRYGLNEKGGMCAHDPSNEATSNVAGRALQMLREEGSNVSYYGSYRVQNDSTNDGYWVFSRQRIVMPLFSGAKVGQLSSAGV